MPATFKGFSTVGRSKPTYTLRDIELVKQDLLNHFYTRKGERVMMPDFGTNIQDYIFEPLIDANVEALEYEVTQVIDQEPRVQFVDMNVTTSGHLVKIAIELLFTPGDVADTLYLEFIED